MSLGHTQRCRRCRVNVKVRIVLILLKLSGVSALHSVQLLNLQLSSGPGGSWLKMTLQWDARPQDAKAFCSVYFCQDGLIAQIPSPKGGTVTGKFICDLVFLPQVLAGYCARRPNEWLHHHWQNARITVIEYLHSESVFVLKYLPNSPDLSPCNLWFFGVLTEKLPGGHYDSRSAPGSALHQCQKVANFDDP